MRTLAILAVLSLSLFAHGIFYSANEGKAIIISANFSQTAPAAYTKVEIFEGDSAIPLLTSRMDSNGRFAFLPPNAGKYNIKLTATSDHGEHKSDFSLDVGADMVLSNLKEPIFQKYAGILSSIGIVFGLFGLIAMIKSRKSIQG